MLEVHPSILATCQLAKSDKTNGELNVGCHSYLEMKLALGTLPEVRDNSIGSLKFYSINFPII